MAQLAGLAADPADICVMTLTYGDRSDLLARMVCAVAGQGVRHVMVLANGVKPVAKDRLEALAKEVRARHGITLEIVKSPQNLGSAAGYGRMIEEAKARAKYAGIWLLDDDNLPRAGALDCLLRQSAAQGSSAAFCAVRTDRRYLTDAAAGLPVRPVLAGEAFGTDLRHLAARIIRRLSKSRPKRPQAPPAVVPCARVPYGGLFVPSALMAVVAPPRADFVIYADDYEYTERLARAGGLYLVGAALVDDMEASWNASGRSGVLDEEDARRQVIGRVDRRRSQASRLATMPPDFRLYYAIRNALWLDRQRCETGSARLWFTVNLALFAGPVLARAVARGRWGNARTLLRAIADARAGHLGTRADYPLP